MQDDGEAPKDERVCEATASLSMASEGLRLGVAQQLSLSLSLSGLVSLCIQTFKRGGVAGHSETGTAAWWRDGGSWLCVTGHLLWLSGQWCLM